MTSLLRWANFWKHQHEFRNYVPGRLVTTKAFYSSRQILVFIPEIEAWMRWGVDNDGPLVAMNNGLLYHSTPEEVVSRLFKPQPEIRIKSIGPERTVIQDYWPRETDVLKVLKVETFPFRLPELSLPDYVRFRTVPKELESLKMIVREAMVRWLCPEGEPLPEAMIPFFDINDPSVCVAVDGKELQRGHFEFEWRGGKWTSSKEWWPDRWERSEVISLVRSNILSTVKIDCPR